ncbi:ABC-type transporter Mla subunit MlaD [Lysinibacillus composti]|uniref:SLH domain-containing protein n=1 Tax=Lysinibacillus composti TaxID=720633 RepID=A0A3N9UJA4_9BACI|nr:S-layer homology domain-containing protein [Lysinibacillus composti]MBM7609081.1 ABC-type transporter Mla subunit MlaD [Lysinibacillus composti]RQW75498.1 hypothetical protein EBB45_04995 [Lysinibacillus composti]
MKYLKKYVVPTLIAAALFSTAGVSAEAKGKGFKDVPNNVDYYHTVQKLVNFKIIGGYSDGTFKPGNYVTRGQAASMIARILGVDLKNVKDPGFKDVSTAYTHYPAIAKLTEVGIFDANEKFNPNRQLTRAEMADILVNAFKLESVVLQSYDDVNKDSDYYQVIGTIGALDITRNVGKFRPEDGVKRANFAVFIERVINFKRNDNKYDDIWDSWGTWDNKGVIKPPKDADDDPKPNIDPKPSEDAQKVEDLKKAIKDVVDNLEDAQEEIDDILENLEEAIEEDDDDDIEEEKDNLSKALKNLDAFIQDAEEVLETAQKANYSELQSNEDQLENAIRKANKAAKEAYAQTFDKEYYEEILEEALEDLEDAIDDAERSLKNNGLSVLKRDYKALESALKDAEKTFESYEDSNVDSLDDEAKDLEEAIEEAEELIKEVEETLEDKLDNQVEYFEDLFDNILDELDEAVDNKDKSDIYDAQERLEAEIENAEKLQKDYSDLDIKALDNEKETLQVAIQKAKDELKNSK